jgi:hypothetical protein
MRRALATLAIAAALVGFSAARASTTHQPTAAGSHHVQPNPFEMGG